MDVASKLGLLLLTLNTVTGKCEEVRRNVQAFGAGTKQTSAQHGQMEDILVVQCTCGLLSAKI